MKNPPRLSVLYLPRGSRPRPLFRRLSTPAAVQAGAVPGPLRPPGGPRNGSFRPEAGRLGRGLVSSPGSAFFAFAPPPKPCLRNRDRTECGKRPRRPGRFDKECTSSKNPRVRYTRLSLHSQRNIRLRECRARSSGHSTKEALSDPLRCLRVAVASLRGLAEDGNAPASRPPCRKQAGIHARRAASMPPSGRASVPARRSARRAPTPLNAPPAPFCLHPINPPPSLTSRFSFTHPRPSPTCSLVVILRSVPSPAGLNS